MKKFQQLTIALFIVVACAYAANAQVQINFFPSIYGKSLDGITFFQVNNQTTTDFNCDIKITVNEEKAGKVAEINATSIFVKRGFNSYNRSLFAGAKTKFSPGPVADIMRSEERRVGKECR